MLTYEFRCKRCDKIKEHYQSAFVKLDQTNICKCGCMEYNFIHSNQDTQKYRHSNNGSLK